MPSVTRKDNQDVTVLDKTAMEEIGRKPGAGAMKSYGPVPPVSEPSDATVQRILASITGLFAGSFNHNQAMLAQIVDELKEVLTGIAENRIKLDQEKKRTAFDNKMKLIDHAEKKMKKASRKEKHGTWDTVMNVLSLVGAAAAIGVGIALCMTGGGAVLGGFMIAIAVSQILMTANTMVEDETKLSIVGHIAKDAGCGEKQIADIEMAVAIGMAVLMVLGAVACCFVPGAQTGGIVAMARGGSAIMDAAILVTSATGDSYYAYEGYRAGELNSDGTKIKADSQKQEAEFKQLEIAIEAGLEYFQRAIQQCTQILEAQCSGAADTSRTLSRAKLTA